MRKKQNDYHEIEGEPEDFAKKQVAYNLANFGTEVGHRCCVSVRRGNYGLVRTNRKLRYDSCYDSLVRNFFLFCCSRCESNECMKNIKISEFSKD